jgi:hypothetical protein
LRRLLVRSKAVELVEGVAAVCHTSLLVGDVPAVSGGRSKLVSGRRKGNMRAVFQAAAGADPPRWARMDRTPEEGERRLARARKLGTLLLVMGLATLAFRLLTV